jgi:hypothetical protein
VRDQLTSAIEQRRIVTFTYQGHPRRVQPAAFGIGGRKGKETLHGFQVDGSSQRGGIPHWRNFYVERMESLVVTNDVFGPNPPGFNPRPFPTTLAALGGPSAAAGTTGSTTPPPAQGDAGGGAKKDQVLPGVPITSDQAAKAAEQAAKAAEQAGKAIAGAADALGKWFRKKR